MYIYVYIEVYICIYVYKNQLRLYNKLSCREVGSGLTHRGV